MTELRGISLIRESLPDLPRSAIVRILFLKFPLLIRVTHNPCVANESLRVMKNHVEGNMDD